MKKKTLLIIFLVVDVFAVLAILGYLYYGEVTARFFENDTAKVVTASTVSSTTTIPSGFQKASLNGVDVYYPESWGFKNTEKFEEALSQDLGPGITFKSESALFTADLTYINVGDVASYNKNENMAKTMEMLKKIYKDRAIVVEKFYATEENYIPTIVPPVNAGGEEYNPRYVESSDGSWRGYWYLANIGQDLNANIDFIGVVVNKDATKVVGIHRLIPTKNSRDFKSQLQSGLLSSNEYQTLHAQIRQYSMTAYAEDQEVKAEVDTKCLKIIDLLK